MPTIRTILALDGESNFKNSMKQINTTLTAMKANVKALSSEYTTNATRVQNLRDQNKQLSELSDQYKEKIKLLSGVVDQNTKAYDTAKQRRLDAIWLYGRESKEAAEATKALHSATLELRNSETQLHNTEAELNAVDNQLHRNQSEIDASTAKIKNMRITLADIGTMAGPAFKGVEIGAKAAAAIVGTAVDGLKLYAEGLVKITTEAAKFSVDAGATFEQSISKLSAISGATGGELDRLADAARKMGESTSKSASQSADALTYMALAGWKTEDMLTGLGPIVKASEAGAMDLATASDLITDSLAAYGKGADDLEGYLNVVTAAQSNSNMSMRQTLEAYKEVAGTFKNLNVPLEESAGILGILANRGIKGSEAGNKLSSVLVNLVGANKNASKAMDALGVSAWDEEGNFIGLTETIRLLGDRLKDVSDEELVKFEAQIGGKLQLDTLQALIAGTSEEFDELEEKLKKSDDALNQTADTMLDNFKGSVTLMKSALEGLGISIYQTFSKDLNSSTKQVSGWIQKLSKAVEDRSLLWGTVQNIFVEIRAAISEKIGELAQVLPEMLRTYNQVLSESIVTFVETVPELIRSTLPVIVSGFVDLLSEVVSYLPEVAAQLPGLLELAVTTLMTLANAILENLPIVLDIGMQVLWTLIDGITASLPEIITTGVDIVLQIVDSIIDNLDELLRAALEILLALIQGIVQNLDKIVVRIPEILSAIVYAIIDNLDLILEAAGAIVLALGEGMMETLRLVWDSTFGIADYISEKFLGYDWAGLGSRIIQGICDGLTGIGTYVSEKVDEAGTAIVGSFMNFFGIHSPSRLMRDQVGKYIAMGVLEGTTETLDSSAADMANSMSTFSNQTMQITAGALAAADNEYMNLGLMRLQNSAGSERSRSSSEPTINIYLYDAHITSDQDVEDLAYAMAAKTREYLKAGGE